MTLSRMLLGAIAAAPIPAHRSRAIASSIALADEQPEIGRHLVVARAGGVEPAGGIADQLLQPMLDMHVDVFERRILVQLARFDLRRDLQQPLVDCRWHPRRR